MTQTKVRGGDSINADVRDYYGKVLDKSEDLKTNACKTGARMPQHIRDALKKVHPDVIAKYYGCGLCIPTKLKGLKVLDLGSGSGRDVYLISNLVGEEGHVTGVDMTEEQLQVARAHVTYHTEAFGYQEPNVSFVKAFIEDLSDLPDDAFDLVVSNCVVNLANNKDKVLSEVYRVLKEGGELYFSDVYSDRRIPQSLVEDKVLYGECLSGALYYEDFVAKAKAAGFRDPRLVNDDRITVNNKAIEAQLGDIRFYSATYRLFKLPTLDAQCEDYGQAVKYLGTVPEEPRAFVLDNHHKFHKGRVVSVCRNTLMMLKNTRFASDFEFYGSEETHYGPFPGCGVSIPFTSARAAFQGPAKASGSGCC